MDLPKTDQNVIVCVMINWNQTKVGTKFIINCEQWGQRELKFNGIAGELFSGGPDTLCFVDCDIEAEKGFYILPHYPLLISEYGKTWTA